MAHDWDIRPRGDACYKCEQAFQDRQHYFSTLVFEDKGYVRADYCETCKPDENESLYSIWQGVFILPPPEPEEALKKETAESLMRRLMEQEDDAHRNVIYILAVMIERKKLLVEKDVRIRDDGVMVRVYEHRKTGETFIVPDPRLRLTELEEVQEEVVAMLGGKRKSPEKAEKADAAAEEAEKPEPNQQG